MTQALLYASAVLAGGGLALLSAGRWLPARWSARGTLGVAAAALALFLAFGAGPIEEVSLFRWLPVEGLAVAVTYRFDALAVALVLLSGVMALLLLLWMGLAAPVKEGPYAPWVLVLLAIFWLFLGSADLLLAYAHWEVLLLATYGLLVFRRMALPTPGIAERLLGGQHLAGYLFLFALLLCGVPLGTWEYTRWGVGAVTGGALLLLLLTVWVRTAQVPLQSWALAVAECPGPASTLLLGGWGLLAGPYLWLRFLSRLDSPWPGEVALVAGSVSLVVSAVLALRQEGGRQVQAGDTIARLSLVWIALGLGGAWGLAAGWFLLMDLLLSKVLVHVALSGGGALERPIRQALYILGMWGGLGLPPSLGFVGRCLLALGLFHAGRAYYLPIVLLSTPLALLYMWRGWNLVPCSEPAAAPLERRAQWGLAGLLGLLPLAGLGAPWLWSALLEPATRAVLGTLAADIAPVLEALLAWLLPATLLLLLGAGGLVWNGVLCRRAAGPAPAAGLTAGPLQEPLPVLPGETAWLAWLGQPTPLYRLLGRLGDGVVLVTRNAVDFLERHTTYFLLAVLGVAAAVLIILTR